VLAFEGWNDACDAASGAAAFLLGQHEGEEPYALIEPEEFYDFQQRRPTVSIEEGGTRSLTWPTTRFYALPQPDAPSDLILVLGEEPHLRWKTYTRHVAQVLADSDAEIIVTLGAFIGQVAHTQPVPVFGVATDPALVAAYGLPASRYEGPTGVLGVLLEACRECGIPAVSLWAACPHYLAANPNPAAMLALTDAASQVTGIPFETGEVRTVADEFRARVDEAMADNEEFRSYVRRLETEVESGDPIDPRAGGRLITEIEQYLRSRDA
jgi:proteasome assembly chaperone (PAC2) family protein